MYECEQGCSRCCGPKSFVAITSNRVIVRQQGTREGIFVFCCCCCIKPHVDTAIYLRDIEVLTESKGLTACCQSDCCASCCGDIPKHIDVKGGFGVELLTFKRPEALAALNELAAIIHPFKERR